MTTHKSTTHKAKFKKLLHPETKRERIGAVSVSFNDQFKIGKGSQGTRVFIGLHDDGSEVAVKRVMSDYFKTSVKNNEEEISGLLNLEKSDCIVHYRDFVFGEPFSYIILDLCEQTLADYVKRNTKEFIAGRGPDIIRDIISGLYALHCCGRKKILHRDLKPTNILVDTQDRVRLADFGISIVLDENETTLHDCSQGTDGWKAVESIQSSQDTKRKVKFKRKSDVQVAGMISFYVLTKGEHPFGKPKYVTTANIVNGNPVNLDMLSDPIAKDFVSLLIKHDINERPDVKEALEHIFLQPPRAINEEDFDDGDDDGDDNGDDGNGDDDGGSGYRGAGADNTEEEESTSTQKTSKKRKLSSLQTAPHSPEENAKKKTNIDDGNGDSDGNSDGDDDDDAVGNNGVGDDGVGVGDGDGDDDANDNDLNGGAGDDPDKEEPTTEEKASSSRVTNSADLSVKAKSTKHKAKFEKLLHSETKLGPVKVSFKEEFIIANGSQGTRVFIGLHDDGSEVAVKRIISDVSRTSEKTDEKNILSLLNIEKSDHIVHYRDYIPGNTFSYIIVDLCEETLADYVEHNTREFLELRGPVIIREILTGLCVLHCGKTKILHRDLKPKNILVDIEDRMRLADFGVSRVLNEDKTSLDTSPQGTPCWMAAESIATEQTTKVKFTQKSDIQAVGMVSFYVLTKGEHPFGKTTLGTMTNISNGKPVNLDMLSDPNAKSFISWLISHDVKDRPHVLEALQHPFLQQHTEPGDSGATHDDVGENVDQGREEHIDGLHSALQGLQSRDIQRRRQNLKLVREMANKFSTDGQSELLKPHLPVILRLAYSCPFEDVRGKFIGLLDELREKGEKIPRRVYRRPSSFIHSEDLILPDGNTTATQNILVKSFVESGRLEHVHWLMGYHPQYFECFLETQHYLMQVKGPLSLDWRCYIAILGASRHHCSYLVRLYESEFLKHGGNPAWVKGSNVPVKLYNLHNINKLLAHQPWTLTSDDMKVLCEGEDSWSLSELVQAIIILIHFHCLSSFVFGTGITPEIDLAEGHSFPPQTPVETTSSLLFKHSQVSEITSRTAFDNIADDEVFTSGFGHYLNDPTFRHENFAEREDKSQLLKDIEYSWEICGLSLVKSCYPEMGQLLDKKFRVCKDLTYHTAGTQVNMDTRMFREATTNYVHSLYGLYHTDYNYEKVKTLMEQPSYKTYVKKVVCSPETTTKNDYQNFMDDFTHSEKVHINLITFEARMQVELLYALRAVAKYEKFND